MDKYLEEFDEGYKINDELYHYLKNNGWEDVSFHNDPCPSFEKNFHLIWIEYPDPKLREKYKKHYSITFESEVDNILFETDDVKEIIKKLKLLV